MAGRPKAAVTKKETVELVQRISNQFRKQSKDPYERAKFDAKVYAILTFRVFQVTGAYPEARLCFGEITYANTSVNGSFEDWPYVLIDNNTVVDLGGLVRPHIGHEKVIWGQMVHYPGKLVTYTYTEKPRGTKTFETWAKKFLAENPTIDDQIRSTLDYIREQASPEFKAREKEAAKREAVRRRLIELCFSNIEGPFEPEDLKTLATAAKNLQELTERVKASLEGSPTIKLRRKN